MKLFFGQLCNFLLLPSFLCLIVLSVILVTDILNPCPPLSVKGQVSHL
jgi:hypothetical protein